MQCGESSTNDPQTSSFSISTDNKKDTKAEVSNMKKQLRHTDNGAAVNTDRQEEIDELRAEYEAIILNLRIDHDSEVNNINIYYESRIGELQFNHSMTVDNLQRDHDIFVHHLRSLNYHQGIRQEAALKSMREIKDQMRKNHDQELQCMRLQYDNLVKEHEIEINGLFEEDDLFWTEQKNVLQNLRGKTQVLREDLKSAKNSHIVTKSDAMIKRLRNVYKNDSSLELSSLYPKQNGTEVEGLQLAEEATTIAEHLQITDGDGHEHSNADITTSTIADDADTTTSTLADDEAVDMAQKLKLLHGYVLSKESNCSTTDDLQQQLDDFEEDSRQSTIQS